MEVVIVVRVLVVEGSAMEMEPWGGADWLGDGLGPDLH